MINTSYFKPRSIAFNGDDYSIQLDRIQNMAARITIDKTKVEEVGRDGIVGWKTGIPDVALDIGQLEYGNIKAFKNFANVASTTHSVNLTSFKTSAVDILGYKTDDDGTFLGTVWYPKFRVSRIGLNISDPQASVERTFELAGENEILLEASNKYFIYKSFTASGGTDETFSITDPTPVADPDNSGRYLFRVVRYDGSDTTELTYGTDYTYSDATHNLTVSSTSAGDIIKVYYSASSYISGSSPFTDNDSDLATTEANGVSIYLATTNYLYRLQSAAVDITFDRYDVREIGNKNVVARGIRDTSVNITLGRVLESYTMEEVLRGVSSSYGKIDVQKLSDNFTLVVKIYSDSTKTTFKTGYKFTELAPTGFDNTINLNDYVNRGATLVGESGIIVDQESEL